MTGRDDPAPDALMLFDGVCHLCDGVVRTVLRLDRQGVIRFTSVQSPFGRRLAIAHGLDPDAPESFLFFDSGRPLRKTAAVAALLRRLPAPWRHVAWIERLPRALTDRAYDWIAANRYQIFGKSDHCHVPAPEQRARFLLD
ncbi:MULTISPECIES: thiol-disulfide oxidoreductase DCC family protein [unclassified Caulobacter]|jgi:predicted DCC family thiol-disulfide oxidoreductase YuxK|nr:MULTISPECIES: thiol-disulfide oxidoreductase DCC family protein [unclassified Caulobacter]AZS23116.1 thiol-disulfide oxidoreductase DCC family protein [Caulobacter sp. FWC26]